MKTLVLLLLFCHVSSPVKHSLKYFSSASTGVRHWSEFVVTLVVDDIVASSCDSNMTAVEPKQDWMKKLIENDPKEAKWHNDHCFERGPTFFNDIFYSVKRSFNQSGGVHILQSIGGCELDDETGEVNGFVQYGYDGEDFISFDMKRETWVAPTQQAFTTKLRWDAEKERAIQYEMYLTKMFPEHLKKYLAFGRSSLLRTELPSVSLLQKTPSSPVSCHATGFYPDGVVMFWRKDGEELHEDVDHGEILPNHDGSFQMSVDLNLSSVPPEDWRRYDCVFHLSGVKDDIVTRLDKDVIKTNWEEPSHMTVPIVAAVVVLAVVLIAAAGFTVYKRKKANCPPSSPDAPELSEELNPET